MEILEPLQVKYRPKDYATVVGQDSVVNILKGLRKGNGYTYSNSLIFYASPGSGKALENNEPVLTTKGFKKISELTMSDKVIGSDGKGHNLLGIYPQGMKECYKVTFIDDTYSICSGDHIWGVIDYSSRAFLNITINEILSVKDISNFGIPYLDNESLTKHNNYKEFKSIEPVGLRECTCIAIDSADHLFVTRDFNLTHNTTLSRIYAKSVNCLNPKDGEACNECEHCISFNRGDYPDFIEVDGASYGKVEDARILIDKLFNQYPIIPNGIRCVLVDECHRLSKQAWDLFLKPLEEGGTKTIFLFATTEFDKIPPAIVSRSIALRVLPCNADQILMQLEKICIAENIKFDKKALARIAYVFKNKMRDAIKTMDMYYKSFGEVTVVELENVEEKILEAVQLAYLSKIQECYKILDNLFIDEELHSILSSVFAAILLYPNVPDTHCGLSETLLQGFKQIVSKENVTEICKEYATLNPKSMQDFKMFCAIVASIGAKSMGSIKPVENGQIRVGRRFCNNFSKESYLTEQEKLNLANKSGWVV